MVSVFFLKKTLLPSLDKILYSDQQILINLEPMNARCSISDAADTKIEVEKKTGETYKFSAILPH